MRLKKSTRNKLKFVTLLLILLTIYIIDFWPLPVRSIWVRYPTLDKTRLVTKILDNFYFPWFLPQSNLPDYQLNIKPNDLAKLNQSLPEPYTFNIYTRSSHVKVPATFIANNKPYSVKVRYHGDLYHHWSGAKKSLRIEFIDESFKGFRELTLLLPETRDFFIESLSVHRAKKLDLITLDNWFATLSVNGESPGIFFIQEHWTSQVLEKNQRTADADLYGELDLENVWDWPQLFNRVDAWKKYSQNPISPTDFASIAQLIKALKLTNQADLYSSVSQIIDLDSFAKWQAHSMLFPSFHQDNGHNMRLFFNRESGLFEFIPFDLELDRATADFDNRDYNTLVSQLLNLPQVKEKRDQILKTYVNDPNNLKDDLDFYDKLLANTRQAFLTDHTKGYSSLFFYRTVTENRRTIIRQFANIKKLFHEI